MVTRRIHLVNEDETLVILGSQDSNLRRVEQEFGVEMFARQDKDGPGATVSVRGKSAKVNQAIARLKEMREKLRKGELFAHDEDVSGLAVAAPAMPFKDVVLMSESGRAIRPRGDHQKRYVEAIGGKDLVFGLGPAGTGKTFLAAACALAALRARRVGKIVLTRPVVESGERLGFLPGDMYEKVNPYLRPLYDAFYSMLGRERFHQWLDDDIIEIVPLAYMRGRTLENAFLILDEAQNATHEQLLMFLTRIGRDSKVVVNGDVTQIDLQVKRTSGLVGAVGRLSGLAAVEVVEFSEADVMRHPLVREILKAYEAEEV